MTMKLALRVLALAALGALFSGCAIASGSIHAFGIKVPMPASPIGGDDDDTVIPGHPSPALF